MIDSGFSFHLESASLKEFRQFHQAFSPSLGERLGQVLLTLADSLEKGSHVSQRIPLPGGDVVATGHVHGDGKVIINVTANFKLTEDHLRVLGGE